MPISCGNTMVVTLNIYVGTPQVTTQLLPISMPNAAPFSNFWNRQTHQ